MMYKLALSFAMTKFCEISGKLYDISCRCSTKMLQMISKVVKDTLQISMIID